MRYLFLIAVALWLMSCGSETIDPQAIPDGRSFFPIDIGRFWEYRVSRITYSEFEEPEATEYFLREVVADTFLDLEGKKSYRLERYSKPDETSNWGLDSIWVARIDASRAIRIENNQPYIRLVFPIEDDKVWNANALNNLGREEYQYDSLNHFFRAGNNDFYETVRVIQKSDSSLIDKDVRWEIYADTVGLIYKYFEVIQYVNDAADPNYGKDQVIGGMFLRQELIKSGK